MRRTGNSADENPHNALVPVEGTTPTIELRKAYDRQKLCAGEPGELFCGFASRTGFRWIGDMEWRLPAR